MSIAKRALMAGSTFAIAGAAGFVMQNGDALAARFADEPEVVLEQPAPQPAVEVAANDESAPAALQEAPIAEDANLMVGNATATETLTMVREAASLAMTAAISALPETPATDGVQVAALEIDEATTSDAAPMPTADSPVTAQGCEVSLTASTAGAAMVRIVLDAPCRPGERVTVQHEALAFTEITGDQGQLDVTVPALAQDAVFFAFFADSEGAMVEARVPEFMAYDRVAVLSGPEDALRIHAREFGADYGEDGHVWVEAPRSPMHGIKAEGGFLTALGNPAALEPQLVEVYTFPTAATRDNGAVRLSVEAEITERNCGRDVDALSLQGQPDGSVAVVGLTLAMPTCDAVGDFLVLNSLLQDLKIAGN